MILTLALTAFVGLLLWGLFPGVRWAAIRPRLPLLLAVLLGCYLLQAVACETGWR